MKLTDDHAFGTVDDKRSLLGHDRDFTHIDTFGNLISIDLEQKIHIERRIVDLTVLDAVNDIALMFVRIADFIGDELKRHLFVETLDRENLVENLLKPLILPLRRRNIALQKVTVGVHLETDQIRHIQNIPEFPIIDSFCHTLPVVYDSKKIKNSYQKFRRFFLPQQRKLPI